MVNYVMDGNNENVANDRLGNSRAPGPHPAGPAAISSRQSDLMDGRIGWFARRWRRTGFKDTLIMSYAPSTPVRLGVLRPVRARRWARQGA